MGRNTIKEFRLQADLRNNVVVDDKHRAYALMTSERVEIWDESYGGLSSPVKSNVKVETPSSTTSVWDGRITRHAVGRTGQHPPPITEESLQGLGVNATSYQNRYNWIPTHMLISVF